MTLYFMKKFVMSLRRYYPDSMSRAICLLIYTFEEKNGEVVP